MTGTATTRGMAGRLGILAAPFLNPGTGAVVHPEGPGQDGPPRRVTFKDLTTGHPSVSGSTLVTVTSRAPYVAGSAMDTGSNQCRLAGEHPVATGTAAVHLGAGTNTSNTDFSGQPLNQKLAGRKYFAADAGAVNDGTSSRAFAGGASCESSTPP